MSYINGKKVLSVVKTDYLNISDEELEFIDTEYKKQLNLLQEDVYKNNTWEIKLGYVELKANVVYNLWTDVSFPSGQKALMRDGTKTAIGSSTLAFSGYSFSGNNYFTLANDYSGYLWLAGTFTDVNPTKAMLNEGSTALPYQEYNGKIIHQKDLVDYAKTSDVPKLSQIIEKVAKIDNANYTLANSNETGQFMVINWYANKELYLKLYNSSDVEIANIELALGITTIDIRTWQMYLWDTTNGRRQVTGSNIFAKARIEAGSTTCFVYKL